MKSNIKYGLLALAVALGSASCSNNEYEYTPAEVTPGAQVFFPLTNKSSVELTISSTSFNIPVQRTDSTEALTVGLKVEGDAKGIYTFPQTVSFAANQAKTNVTVGVDNTKLQYDSLQTVTVTIVPKPGYHISQVMDNNFDVTSQVSGGKYVIKNINTFHEVHVFFERATEPIPVPGPGGETG